MRDYIECKPVMLPAEEFESNRFLLKHRKEGALSISAGHHTWNFKDWPAYEIQHLYLVSDEEIKEIDWYIHNNQALQHKTFLPVKGTKVIATTDKLLGLPPISQSFIEEYVQKQGKIDKVRVRLTNFYGIQPTIIILPMEDKMYNREEVMDILSHREEELEGHDYEWKSTLKKWFDKNYPK